MKNICIAVIAALALPLAACMAADEPVVDQEEDGLACVNDGGITCCASDAFHTCCLKPPGTFHCYGG